jgi:hypothetical protein
MIVDTAVDTIPVLSAVAAHMIPDSRSVTVERRGPASADGRSPPSYSSSSARVPIAHESLSETSPDGRLIAFVTTSGVPQGVNNFRLVAIRANGDTAFSRGVPYTPDPVSRRTADSAFNAALARLREPLNTRGGASIDAMRAASAREFESRGRAMIPDVYQPYGAMFVARDHSIWIRLRATSGPWRWIGVDSAGRNIGAIETPRNTTLVEVDGRAAWAIEADANDLQTLVRLRLNPPTAG